MSTNIIDRLTATLEARTTAALADLDRLDTQLAEAIEQAERVAQERITARLDAITGSIEQRLAGFTAHVTEMAGHALQTALDAIGQQLDHATNMEQEQSRAPNSEQQIEQPSTPATEFNSPDWLAEANRRLDEQAAKDRETTTPTVAAHAVESDGIAVLDDIEDIDHTTDDVPTTTSAEGLHTREDNGTGRAKYHPVGYPTPGEVYYVRDHRRHWNPVRFVGG